MIGWLNGRVVHQLRNGAVLIDVQGVGYEVHVASSETPPFNELLELFIYTVVREDAIQLFGFQSADDREFFELLLEPLNMGTFKLNTVPRLDLDPPETSSGVDVPVLCP